jgi:hypothetical protein
MINRRVKTAWGEIGTVQAWEPLTAGMCDALLRFDDGRTCWFYSGNLTPIDDCGPLPSREEEQARAKREAVRSLKAIRAKLVAEWNKPWPGAEFGKALVGQAIDGALADLGDPDGTL